MVFMTSNINTSINMDYCEIKNLQSPHVKKIDEDEKSSVPYTPFTTCNIITSHKDDKKKALLECVKLRQNWYKF